MTIQKLLTWFTNNFYSILDNLLSILLFYFIFFLQEKTMFDILGSVRQTYNFDFLLECREKDEEFKKYLPGGSFSLETNCFCLTDNLTKEKVDLYICYFISTVLSQENLPSLLYHLNFKIIIFQEPPFKFILWIFLKKVLKNHINFMSLSQRLLLN